MLEIITVLLSVPAAMVALFELASKVSDLVEKFKKNTEAED